MIRPSSKEPAPPDSLKDEVERFLASLSHPVLIEDGVEVFDLSDCTWRFSIEFGKLIFEAWNGDRSLVRRLERVAYAEAGRLGLVCRKSALHESSRLEFCEAGVSAAPAGSSQGAPRRRASTAAERNFDRTASRQSLVAALRERYAGWHFERVSQRSDREHSFSAWYTRGWARPAARGIPAWAFLGLRSEEGEAAADSALAFGLIWLDWLRQHFPRVAFSGLKLFLPPLAAEINAHRAAYLRLAGNAAGIEIYAWNSEERNSLTVSPLDLADFGNVETLLPLRRDRESLLEAERPFLEALLHRVLGERREGVDLVADAARHFVSLRIHGLEVARAEAGPEPRLSFGIAPAFRRLEPSDEPEFAHFLNRVVRVRCAASDDTRHELYRLQAERWLESMLVRDLTRLDPRFVPGCLYPQVPAFAGTSAAGVDRGVIDILGAVRDQRGRNRLAVIELKVQEEINLPLQALDYWLRVNWLHRRGQFKARGYFPSLELSPEPPLLYLVSPAFRFHSSTGQILRYFDPVVEVIQVGINDPWREGVRVLFRRTLGRGE